ncbi:MAG: hypothetical protein C4521_09980 [Actinobacteria bacterium]|nr:MAG: hypothetical protein C4521_09980 [Actinomycetota bacterium]
MRLLVITHAEYGKRILANISAHAPEDWVVEEWRAPRGLPPVIDDPDDFLPDAMPHVDLILSLAEDPGVAELLPDVARATGAQGVIAAIDNESWLPAGLAAQTKARLDKMGVASVYPKPLCTLTDKTYGFRKKIEYDSEPISEFARHFGKPAVRVSVEDGKVAAVEVERDACCGCARYVAERLPGVAVRDAEFEAGMLHHHYPCLATMGIDEELGDTLMHVSGHLLKDEIAEQIRPHKPAASKFRPTDDFVPVSEEKPAGK